MIHLKAVNKYLSEYFGFDSFRPGQQQVIESILRGDRTVAIFPTGSGKSLCYQLPALMFPGITIVISPLISLMKDQVDQLSKRGIPCTYISSIVSENEVTTRIQNMKQGKYKIVYIAPERFYSQEFIDALEGLDVSFIAIDEAHCISQWGHNFRPAYLKIKDLIEKTGNPMVAAFTATASRRVQQDIVRLLNLKNCKIFVGSFDRPNLEFRVERPSNKQIYVYRYIKKNIGKPGIIYAATRKHVEDLYQLLLNNGISVGMYHAGLSNEDRNLVQEAFSKGKISVMVATNAFGMGIDKSDIRYIIHYNMPRSIEYYYQEVGRAGRDGKLASCILLYSESDYYLNRFLIGGNYPPIKLVESIYNRVCKAGSEGIKLETLVKSHGSISKQLIHSSVRKLVEYNYVQIRRGIVYRFLPGRMLELTQEDIDKHKQVELEKLAKIMEYCNSKGCLRSYILEYFNETPSFTRCGNCSVCGSESDGTKKEAMDELLTNILTTASPDSDSRTLNKGDEGLLKNLKGLRGKIARRTGMPENKVFDDDMLEIIAAVKPTTRKQMLKIDGIGDFNGQLYADEFLIEIHRYLRKKA